MLPEIPELPDEPTPARPEKLTIAIQSPDGIIRESLLKICNEETAISIAKYIVERMRREADRDTLDFDFHIDARTGTMGVGESFQEKNTWFRFDTKPFNLLHDLKVIEHEQNNNASENGITLAFHDYICQMMLEHCGEEVEYVLREKMFGGRQVPIKLRKVTHFDMADFSHVPDSENYQLLIEKDIPKSVIDTTAHVGVSPELFRIHLETGKGFNEIIREKKAAGDPNYQYVKSAYTAKMLYECEIDFFVDYSGDPIKYHGQVGEDNPPLYG